MGQRAFGQTLVTGKIKYSVWPLFVFFFNAVTSDVSRTEADTLFEGLVLLSSGSIDHQISFSISPISCAVLVTMATAEAATAAMPSLATNTVSTAEGRCFPLHIPVHSDGEKHDTICNNIVVIYGCGATTAGRI